ncbi:MAG: restriction endonuclease subunit S [Deltaproteobacteria bacterium]|nr:restriction endonuclease subunit S [Deltaproteobacteria bacterium]
MTRRIAEISSAQLAPTIQRVRLDQCLEEVTKGIGPSWHKYRLIGATRGGLAPAKEGIGKNPERYKLVEPRTIFYNPMRILLGSIAFLDESKEAGITSPDYVVFKGKPGVLHPRWFYYWLRSNDGATFIKALTRGAVRERMLFRRLATAEIELPSYDAQLRFAQQMPAIEQARAAAEAQLEAAKVLPAAYLREVFDSPEARKWPRKPLGESCLLLPSKSIATNGDTDVRAITTACLTEMGFDPSGVKQARMWAKDAAECVVSSGEILIARSNTPELVGRVAMFTGSPEKAVASDLTIRIWPRDGILSPFLTGYLASLYVDGYWRDRAGGASGSMKKITRTQIESELIPVPPLTEQQRIASLLAEKMKTVSRLRKVLGEQLAAIDILPATLLHQAFNGAL